MYKSLLAAVLLFSITHARAQRDSLYAEALVISFTMGQDTVTLTTPKKVVLRNTGCTDVIPIGKIGDQELGIQFELLNSDLNYTSSFISGTAFYHRQNGEWKMIGGAAYHEAKFSIIPDNPATTPPRYAQIFAELLVGNGRSINLQYKERYLFFGKRLF